MGDPAYGGHAIGKRTLNFIIQEPYRQSEWADVSPLMKYISEASFELIQLLSPKGAFLISIFVNILFFLGFGKP